MKTLGFFPSKFKDTYFNNFTEDYKTTKRLLVKKKLPLKQINDGTSSQFKFEFINRRLYLINKSYKIPCSAPLKNRLLISVYYIPSKNDSIYIDESYYEGRDVQIYIDIMFYVNYVRSLTKKKKFYFLSLFNNFSKRIYNDCIFQNRLIYECEFDEFTKNKLYIKFDTLGIISTLLIQHNFDNKFNQSRFYQKISLIDEDSFGFNFYFSKKTFDIDSKQRFFSSIFKKLPDLNSLIKFFEIEDFRNSLNGFLNIHDSTSFELIKHIERKIIENYSMKNKGGLLNNPKNIKYLSKKEKLPYLFIKDYTSRIKSKLRALENNYRIEKGYNIVGSLVSESLLYSKLKSHFKSYKIIPQGSPKWLKRQRIDIYFPELNIGVEYQGVQHFKPVDFFGGEEGFIQTQERDKRKKNLCKRNGCTLIYVLPEYDIKQVITEIENSIKNIT